MKGKSSNTEFIEKGIGIVMRIGIAVAAIFMIVGFIILLINNEQSVPCSNDALMAQI